MNFLKDIQACLFVINRALLTERINMESKIKKAIEDLFFLNDADFINLAYRIFLGRDPDPLGWAYYLKQIRAGDCKSSVIHQIITSPEGRGRVVDWANLKKPLRKEGLRKIPLVGSYLYKIATGGYAGKKLRIFENRLYVQSQLLSRQYRFIEDQLSSINNFIAENRVSINKNSGEVDVVSVRAEHLSKEDIDVNQKFDPARYFDGAWYLKMNQDVAQAGFNPYQHFIEHGYAERRLARYFDGPRYLMDYPDVACIGADPYQHYLMHGVVEGRLGKYFDPIRYRANNPDMSGHGADIFSHYVENWQDRGDAAYSWIPVVHFDFNPSNGYRIAEGGARYTYIPPAKPVELNRIVREFSQRPLFSLLVPVYNTPADLLEKLYRSVLLQWYIQWELILINDSSSAKDILGRLDALDDPRVKAITTSKNLGIAGATNFGLEVATGEYVVLLDHDDELTPDCLFELAVCINREGSDYIYSDEDKIDASGRYVEPHFKPDWSPDTMMSTMYVCHVSCIRTSLLRDIGGLRSLYDGCQDWDLVLRLTERTGRISHIPKVLYHWRIIPESIAANIAAKAYVLEASKKVREEALARRGIDGVVEPLPYFPGYFRVNYYPRNNPCVSIIIPSRDNSDVLRKCIDSITTKSTYRNFEIVIVDNGSVKDETRLVLSTLSMSINVTVVRHDIPFNYSELNNVGVANSRGDVLIFLNDDTEVITTDWIERLAGYAQLPHVGAVGAKLLYPDNTVQHAGVLNLDKGPGHAFLRMGERDPGYFMRNQLEYNWLAVTGACLAIERSKYLKVGGFDETFPIAYNDVELCFSLVRAGYWNVVCQAVELYHHESVSRGIDHLDPAKLNRLIDEKRRLYLKHDSFFMNDPFYNSNLHPNSVYFELV